MRLTKIRKCLSFSILLLIAGTLSSQQTSGWRGPDRNGFYGETGLLREWPSDGPELLWETRDAGRGYSSPVIVNDILYITGLNSEGSREIFSAYNLNGEKIYEVEYGSPWDNTYPETRTTSAVYENKAYMISGSGEIVCVNTGNGEILWSVDGGKLFERNTGRWGTAESPLVFDNKVIFSPGGDKTTMVALNAETGETVWKTKSLADQSSYVSPILISYNGNRKIIGVTNNHVVGVNPETGNIDWTFSDWGRGEAGRENIAPNTPLYHNGRLFFSFGYDIGSFMLQLSEDASEASLVWRNDDFDTHIGGFVLVNGIIYGSNWINNSRGNWMAIDWLTGDTYYEDTWSGKSKGSIITADSMLYCYEERLGTVGLVEANTNGFNVVSEFRITQGEGPNWAHPVIHNGVLYIRHGSTLMAYSIKE
jgi:outer membrane protein assembly factor BamB